MSEQMEKLIKRIIHDIEMHHRWASQGTTRHDTSRRIARGLIARIGNAVLGGEYPELDKLLGVAGRLEQDPQTRPYAHGVEQSLRGWILNRFDDGARTFIALRQEGGKDASDKAS